jgi:hypothetical protein
MRTFFAVVLLAVLTPLQAFANCECKCLDGRVQSVCTAPNEVAATCAPAACTGVLPEGFAPLAASPVLSIPETARSATTERQPQGQQQQSLQGPAGPTITVPPSITGPASGPPAFSPNGRRVSSDIAPASTTTGQRQSPTTTSSSTTGSDPPAAVPTNPQSLCYERRVFNSDTLEYEWRRACD